jgi:hypothetical protein
VLNHQDTQAHGGGGGVAPRNLNLGTRCTAQLHAPTPSTAPKSARDKTLAGGWGALDFVSTLWRGIISCTCRECNLNQHICASKCRLLQELSVRDYQGHLMLTETVSENVASV